MAKQDFLLDTLLQLGRKLDSTTSEMKSNHIAYEAMFQEIASATKV